MGFELAVFVISSTVFSNSQSTAMTETEKGEIVKMEVDYSASCDEKIPVAEKFAEEGNVEGALEILMGLEKLCRTVRLHLHSLSAFRSQNSTQRYTSKS